MLYIFVSSLGADFELYCLIYFEMNTHDFISDDISHIHILHSIYFALL